MIEDYDNRRGIPVQKKLSRARRFGFHPPA
jgi:hypothetical protein